MYSPILEEQTLEQWPHGQVPRLLNGLSASHQWWYNDKPSQWMDLSGKWTCVRSHCLFLQRSMSTRTRIVTCWLTWAGAASWVDFTNNQSTLTAACSCWACRNILHDIQCSSKRHACCHRDVAWDLTVVDAWTVWPSTTSRIIPQWCYAVIWQRRTVCHRAVLWCCNTAVAAWAASPAVFKGASLMWSRPPVLAYSWHLVEVTGWSAEWEAIPAGRGFHLTEAALLFTLTES